MKINIKPAGYLITGGNKFVDQVIGNSFDQAKRQTDGRADGSRVEPLHPESLVIELAQALAEMVDDLGYSSYTSDEEKELDMRVIKCRALISKVTGGSGA